MSMYFMSGLLRHIISTTNAAGRDGQALDPFSA